MGYTKRMCEKYLLSLNKNIVICRFGNIIGSSGSVYEIFDKQAQKGTITVTHEEMERYFITVEKAVSNLIYSSNFGTCFQNCVSCSNALPVLKSSSSEKCGPIN